MALLGYTQENGIWRARTASLSHYLPEYMQRAVAFWADPRIGNRYYVHSGSRSYAHQAALYNGWRLRLPGFNPANAPGTSKHEYGKTPAAAMDVHPTPGQGGTYAELHRVAREYGFHFPIAPREDWHMELWPQRKPLPNKAAAPQEQEEEEMPQCEWNDGAVAVVNAKGEVFCPKIPGRPIAKHWGGMTNLRDDVKRSFTKATVIAPIDRADSQAGYFILDESWGFDDFWKFEPGVEKYFK